MAKSGIADMSTAVGSKTRGKAPAAVAALTIVSHPQADRAGDSFVLDAVAAGREVNLSRNAPAFARPGQQRGAPLGDPFVSRKPIRFAPAPAGGIRLSVDGGTPVTAGTAVTDHLDLTAEDIAAGVPLELAERVVVLLHAFDPEPGTGADPLGMIGYSGALRRVRAAIERLVDLVVPVLIRGETGTGKELVARAIHHRSTRRDGPFVSVNLGAIPRELAAAELFGAARGAYTGATRDREGLFRAAHGGTLFLDEVGEAPPEVQVMLLRLIAATDADLEDHIRRGRFRAPLLHRLAGYEVRMPALRERRDDLGVLFYHFARVELTAIGELERLSPRDPHAAPWLPASIAARLVRHSWPGNIRQLKNVTRQLVIGSRGLAELRLDPTLEAELATAGIPAPGGAAPAHEPAAARRKPSEISAAELIATLRSCAWDVAAAADMLRIPRPSMYDLIDKTPQLRTAGDLASDEIVQCFFECGGDLDAMVHRLEVSKRALNRRIKELGLTRHT